MLRMRNVVLGGLLALLVSGAAFAQNGWWRWGGDGDHDRDDGYYNQERREQQRWYQRGVREGRDDREDGRRPRLRQRNWDDAGDRNAYLAGYRAGYGRWGDEDDRPSYGWHDPEEGGGWRGGGWGYNQISRQAFSIGYQDGVNDGAQDRRTGHSYRPTHDDNYKHADRGYDSSYGDKQAYKNEYRNGYAQGYQRGYNSAW